MKFNSLENDVCFNHLGQKLGEAKSVIFQEQGKTHQNTMILTMCKIYNVNNNKTADII